MRHNKHKNKLGLNRSHRLAVVRNLVTQLLQFEQITTTLARSKTMKSQIDKIITLAKKKDLPSRKKIISFLKNKIAVKKLYEDYLEIYQERISGFTRIHRLKNRLGDNASMVLISMVDKEKIAKKADQTDASGSTLKQVKKDVENSNKTADQEDNNTNKELSPNNLKIVSKEPSKKDKLQEEQKSTNATEENKQETKDSLKTEVVEKKKEVVEKKKDSKKS